MKKTIFIVVEYLDIKGKVMSKVEEAEMRHKLYDKAVKEFKREMKDLLDSKIIKIIKENFSVSSINIEYSNSDKDIIYPRLLSATIVEVIDSQIYE